jgi:hypothetical protein
MKNRLLKIAVVILFLLQAAIAFLFIDALNSFFITKLMSSGIISSKGILFALVILSLIISLFFVILILSKVGKTITVIKEVPATQSGKSPKEPKQKKGQDPEQKIIQQQNEKKNQIVADLMVNLNDQLELEDYSNQALINISKQYDIFQAIFFVKDQKDEIFKKAGTYAYYTQEDLPEFTDGVGLTGQVASNKRILNISNLPDKYITVLSGLGKSSPSSLLIVPVLYADKTIGIIELASFIKFDLFAEQVLEDASRLIGQQIVEILKKPLKVQS